MFMSAHEYHIKISSVNQSAAELIASAAEISITQAKQAMQKGAVWLTDKTGTRRLRRKQKTLPVDSTLHFYYNALVLSQRVEPPLLLSDERDYSVWIKPRGVLSQGSKWADHCAITRLIESDDEKQRPAFLIHRLDKAASGLMLIGHSKKVTHLLAEMFARRSIQKTYEAIVKGRFDAADTIELSGNIEGRKAISRVRIIEYNQQQDQTLLEVRIETGRKHQIRRHLSNAGFPIVGDRLYGGGDSRDLQLAAVSLGFRCPLDNLERAYRLPDTFRPAF